MLFLLFNLPSVQAMDPSARWGQQAVYVDGTNQMYVVGGASSNVVSEVTNDVYILSVSAIHIIVGVGNFPDRSSTTLRRGRWVPPTVSLRMPLLRWLSPRTSRP